MTGPDPTGGPPAQRVIGAETWHGPAETLAALETALASDGTLVKENRRRTVHHHPWPTGGTVFVKRFRDSGLGQTMKALAFGARAQREIRYARELASAGVPVAEPLAWAERPGGGRAQGAVATRGVADAVPAIDVVHDRGCPADRRRAICAAVARDLRRAHDAGIGFRDFHLGNVLVGPGGTCTFIDLQSAWHPGPLLARIRLVNLAMALTSIPRAAWRDARRALRDYGPLPGLSERAVARWVARRAQRMVLRHFRSRAERCVRDSTEFRRRRTPVARVFQRRDADAAEIDALPAAAQDRAGTRGPDVLKDARESLVVRGLTCGGRPIVAKQYRPKGALPALRQDLGWGRGRRAWVAGNTCRALGVPVALPIALLELAGGVAWLVMEECTPHRPLDREIATRALTGPVGARHRLAQRLGAVFGAMHAERVIHADCKACNVLVDATAPAGPDIRFVDYDRVRFVGLTQERELHPVEAIETLVQLTNSIPRAVTRSDRWRFLRAYLAAGGGGGGTTNAKALWRSVWSAARGRGILWVGPDGDVHERWEHA